MITADELVNREVLVCASMFIDDFVKVYNRAISAPSNPYAPIGGSPLPWDYEDEILLLHRPTDDEGEIFEHWIVTSWFAKRLIEHGERVVELSNLYFWCRTTTGQQISADYVIEQIVKDLNE